MSQELLAFLLRHRYAVVATVSRAGLPDAALVHIAVTPQFELVFDTLGTTRKALNLHDNARVALVVGGWTPGDERTAQIDGIADFPQGAELERLQSAYFATYPDGRERLSWEGLLHVRVRPVHLRYTDFTLTPPRLVEHDFTPA